MRILIRTLSMALVITIPITAISLGTNVTCRMPDIYQYEFKATNSLKYFDVDKNNDEMGEFISHFMTGREEEFQIQIGDEDRPLGFFNKNEQNAAVVARQYLNIIAGLGVISLILMLAAFVLLKKYEMDSEIRNRFRLGTMAYLILIGTYFVIFYMTGKSGHTLWDMLKYVPLEEDVLPQLITEGMIKRIYVFIPVVSTVIMGAMAYVVHKITEPKKIFSRNY